MYIFRRLSGGSQGDRSSSGHRTPTGRLTPTNSGNATPVNLPSPSQESTSSQPKPLDLDIIVPEIPVSNFSTSYIISQGHNSKAQDLTCLLASLTLSFFISIFILSLPFTSSKPLVCCLY